MNNQVRHGTGSPPEILLVGNFLSTIRGTRSVCEDLSEILEARNWKIYRTSAQSNRVLRIVDMIATTVARRNAYQCASVDVFSGPAFFLAEVVCYTLRMINRPYILTLHGGGLANFARQWQRRVTMLLDSAAAVTTPSMFLKKELTGIRSDIHYVPNGLSVADYSFRLRKKVSPNLAWLRAFHDIYDPLLAVRTIEQLRVDFPSIHLTMYGPDKCDGSLIRVRNYIARHGLENCISIPGAIPKSKVPGALARHDLFLNTTTLESFGVCVAEAAACGLPVVTTAVGELPFLYRDEEEILLVPQGDAEAMAAAVRRLLTEPELAGKLAVNARKKVEQFDWSVVLPQWEALFVEVAGRQGK